jgi:membrane protein YdbS with pleckstrin-like domain
VETNALKPMRPTSASELRERSAPSTVSLVIRMLILVAAVGFGLIARYVSHLPELVAIAIAGAGVLMVIVISLVVRAIRGRKTQ